MGTAAASTLAAAASCRTNAGSAHCTDGGMKWTRSYTPCLSGSPLSASQSLFLLSQLRRKANESHRMAVGWDKPPAISDSASVGLAVWETKMTYSKGLGPHQIDPAWLRAKLAEIEKEIAWNERRLENLILDDVQRQLTEDLVTDLRQERQRFLGAMEND